MYFAVVRIDVRILDHCHSEPLTMSPISPYIHSQVMWVLADVVGLFPVIVGRFSRNVGPSERIFSANAGQRRRMLSGPAIYVLGPLQVVLLSSSYLVR